MRRWVEIAACLALCALTWCGIEAVLVLRDRRGVPDQVLALTADQLTAAQGIVEGRLASMEERADRQMSVTRGEVLARVDALIERTDARTGEVLALVDDRLGEVTQTVAGIGGKAEETAKSATRLVESTDRICGSRKLRSADA